MRNCKNLLSHQQRKKDYKEESVSLSAVSEPAIQTIPKFAEVFQITQTFKDKIREQDSWMECSIKVTLIITEGFKHGSKKFDVLKETTSNYHVLLKDFSETNTNKNKYPSTIKGSPIAMDIICCWHPTTDIMTSSFWRYHQKVNVSNNT